MLVVNVLRDVIHLFQSDAVAQIPFLGMGTLKGDVAYNLLKGGSFNGNLDLSVSLSTLESSTLFYRFVALFNSIVPGTLLLFIYKHSSDIFKDLSDSHKSRTYFSVDNYFRIKNVGFLLLSYSGYYFISGAIVSWFVLNDVSFMGNELIFNPDYLLLAKIVTVLVVFVFAEIYRAGIEMKEETDLTI